MIAQTQTVNVVLPKALIGEADKAAKKEYKNRSELIREALRVYLKDKQEWEDIFTYGEKQAQKLGLKSEKDVDKIVSEYRH